MAKREFANAMTLRTLRRGEFPGVCGSTQCHHRVLPRGRQEDLSQKERLEEATLLASGTEPGATGQRKKKNLETKTQDAAEGLQMSNPPTP